MAFFSDEGSGTLNPDPLTPPKRPSRIFGDMLPKPAPATTYPRAEPSRPVAGGERTLSDPFAPLKPIGDVLGGIGSAVGSVFEKARDAPLFGGALGALGTAAETAVKTPVGLAALGADQVLGTGLTQAAQRENRGRSFLELPNTVTRALTTALGRIADDPSRDPLSRAIAGTARGTETAGEIAAPLPGFHGLAVARRMAVEGRLGLKPSAASEVGRVAAEAPKPGPIFSDMPRTPRTPSAAVRAAPDPRDLGYNPETTFSRAQPRTQEVIQDTAEAEGGFTVQRRGVQRIAETKRLAEEVGADPAFVEKAYSAKPGTAMNAEEIYATAQKVKATADRRVSLQDQVIRAGGPQHASSELNAQLLLASVEQAQLQRTLSGVRTEAGRSLRILREALDEAVAARTPSAYDRALNMLGGRANAERFIQRLNEIWAREVPEQVKRRDTYNLLQQVGESGVWDKVTEVWINSILSSPITHQVNSISNLAFAILQPPTRLAAATSEAALTLGGKLRPREVFFSEASASTLGALRGVQEGLRKGLEIARHGFDAGEVHKFAETGRIGRPQAIGGTLGTVVNVPGRLLAAEDAVFKAIANQSEIAALAARQAAKERLGGQAFARRVAEIQARPTPAMLEAAQKAARYATFQSEADRLTRVFMDVRNRSRIGVFVVPFIQTPTNLLKRGLEYSPAGFVRAAMTTGAERSFALARASIGSMVMTYFASKMLEGQITASAPRNPAERDAFYRSGRQPYSIKIGDQWVEFQRLEPLMTPVKWMASAYEAWRDGEDPTDAATKAVGAILGALKDSSYLAGIQNLIDAMEDPEHYSEQVLAHVAGGFVPFSSLLRNVAQAQDPTIRAPETFEDRILANLPGASKNVPPRLDVYGRPVQRTGSRTGAGALLFPNMRPETADPIDREISRVREHAPFPLVGFTGSSAKGEKLDDQGKFRLQEIAGQRTYDALRDLFGSVGYAAMGWAAKASAIQKTVDKARDEARDTLLNERHPIAKGRIFKGMLRGTTQAKPRAGSIFGDMLEGATAARSGSIFGPMLRPGAEAK